jgi:hypothetical protein
LSTAFIWNLNAASVG